MLAHETEDLLIGALAGLVRIVAKLREEGLSEKLRDRHADDQTNPCSLTESRRPQGAGVPREKMNPLTRAHGVAEIGDKLQALLLATALVRCHA